MLFADGYVLLATLLLHGGAGKPLLKTVAHLPHPKDNITRVLMLRETSEDGANSAGEVSAAWLWPARTPTKLFLGSQRPLSSSPFPQLSQFVSTEWRESQSKQITLTPLSRWHLASVARGTLRPPTY